MIKGCMFYVAGYDRPIEIVSRIEKDKTDSIYKDGELVETIINDDIKLLKVLQKLVEEMKRKDKKMKKAPKDTLPLDTIVLVWDIKGQKKSKRHFKRFTKKGKIVCFSEGKTSWTTTDNTGMKWKYWKLAK